MRQIFFDLEWPYCKGGHRLRANECLQQKKNELLCEIQHKEKETHGAPAVFVSNLEDNSTYAKAVKKKNEIRLTTESKKRFRT